MKNAVLAIYYKNSDRTFYKQQGKIYQDNGKWIYLQDMTPTTYWHKFGGYSIAEQILDGFSKAKIKPQIIFRRKDLNQLYLITSTKVRTKGIKAAFGGHTQYIVPMGSWEVKVGSLGDEPKDLPVLSIDQWLKGELKFNPDGSFSYA